MRAFGKPRKGGWVQIALAQCLVMRERSGASLTDRSHEPYEDADEKKKNSDAKHPWHSSGEVAARSARAVVKNGEKARNVKPFIGIFYTSAASHLFFSFTSSRGSRGSVANRPRSFLPFNYGSALKSTDLLSHSNERQRNYTSQKRLISGGLGEHRPRPSVKGGGGSLLVGGSGVGGSHNIPA